MSALTLAEIQAKRREAEYAIAVQVARVLQDLHASTGVVARAVSVQMIDVTRLDSASPEFQIGGVSIDLGRI